MTHQHGVLPSQWIRAALEDGTITGEPAVSTAQIQPNSLDLRLSEEGYRIQCSFLPGEQGVYHKLERFKWYDICIPEAGYVVEPNQACLFRLCERLQLPKNVSARANPKSSTGRLDVFCRLVTESGDSFDEAPSGYKGQLFLEVVPRSFAVKVRPGDCLAQIRFNVGDPRLNQEEMVAALDSETILLNRESVPLRSSDIAIDSGLVLSIDLPRRGDHTVGYRARKHTPPIDLRAIGAARIRHYWDRIHGDNKPVILEPDEFYIFASRELVRLPPQYCAEMVAFDASSGEVRTHYAGFFDSGFGYSPDRPAAVVLEVRSRDVPFLIEDGQPLFRVHLMRCTAVPDLLYGSAMGSNYHSQRLRLSKQFTSLDEVEGEASCAAPSHPALDFTEHDP